MDLTFQAVTAKDEEFLVQVFASTMAEKLATGGWPVNEWASMIESQFRAQHFSYRKNFPKATFEIVVVDGEQAGRLYLDRRSDEIRILELTFLPAYRGQGIGTRLIKDLCKEAHRKGHSVGVHIQRGARSMSLAARLGFAPQLEAEYTTFMIWRPRKIGDGFRGKR